MVDCSNMLETAVNAFDNDKFCVEKYVGVLVQECVGGAELQQRKSKIQAYSDHTSSSLKRHVYANYMQFIETAKEISHLESEMYQLSHIIFEQRYILSSLAGFNSDNVIKDEEEYEDNLNDHVEDLQSVHAIRAIKELVQGYTGILDGKTFLNEGALIELDSNDYRPIQKVHFFLLNDVLLICKVKHDRNLEFLRSYDPSKIAVINIKDLDGIKNAINIITSDGSKIFQSVTISSKNEWIEKFEVAFKFNQSIKHKQGPTRLRKEFLRNSLETRSVLSDSSPIDGSNSVQENWAPEWLSAAPEDIEGLIAQRYFEDALALVQKSEEFIESESTFWNASDIAAKIKKLRTNFANTLIQELSNNPKRNLQASLRSARRSLRLLAEMGKAREACGTLLKVCSNAIRVEQREARRSNANISELFFCDLAEVTCEFMQAFNKQSSCVSALVVWCNTELQYFCGQLIKHFLSKGTQLDTVAEVVEGVRKPCAMLKRIGLDFSYQVEGLLRSSLEQLIEESRIRLLETVGRTEDLWQPYNLRTKSHVKSFLRELESMGMSLRDQITGDTWINLTQSTLNFCRHFLALTDHCAVLAKNESLKVNVENLLRDLLTAQLEINPSPDISVDLNFVSKNKNYIIEELLPLAIDKFEKKSGSKSEILSDIKVQMRAPPRPKPRSVYTTDVL